MIFSSTRPRSVSSVVLASRRPKEIVQEIEREATLRTFCKEKINRAKSDHHPFFKVPA
jgi:hypothetical protein